MTRPGNQSAHYRHPGHEALNIPVAAHRFMAERAGSRRTVELAGGSHTVAIRETATLVDLTREAAAGSRCK